MSFGEPDINSSEWPASLYLDKDRRWIYGKFVIHPDYVKFKTETQEEIVVYIPLEDIIDIKKAYTGFLYKAIYIVKINGDKVWLSSLPDRNEFYGALVHRWRAKLIQGSGTSSGTPVGKTGEEHRVEEEHRGEEEHLDSPYAKAMRQKDNTLIKRLVRDNVRPSQQDIQFAVTHLKDVDNIEKMAGIIKAYIKNQSNLIKHVRATYIPGKVKEVVFVAFTTTTDKINISLPYTVVFRKIDDYSTEGAEVTYSKESLRKPFTKQESMGINAALQKHSEYLMDNHKNIQMISACPVISKNFGSFDAKIIPKTCIVIYVDLKGLIPIGENPLPKILDTIPVDVREGGPRLLNKKAPDEFHEHLSMGCQVTSDFGAGTLGAFLENSNASDLYFLTCAHVVVKPEDFAQSHDGTVSFKPDHRKVYQPYPSDINQIGHVEKAVFKRGNSSWAGVDVALVRVTNTTRRPRTGEFPTGNVHAAGFTDQRPMVYTSGEMYTRDTLPDQFESRSEVIKFGASSGPTRGSFLLNGTSVRRRDIQGTVMSFGFELHNQIEVLSIDPANNGAFAESGDSGSLVFIPHKGNCSDLRAIGILEGATFNNTFIVTPIWDVLQALNVPLQLKSFPLHEQQESSLSASFQRMSLSSDEMADQLAATNVHINSEIEELHLKMDQISEDLHNRISNTEETNKRRHNEVMGLLNSLLARGENR